MSSSAGHTILAWTTGAVMLVGAGALVGAYIAGRPSGEALALQIRTERAAHAQAAADWDAQLQAAVRRTEHVQSELDVERGVHVELERTLQKAEQDLGQMRDKLAFYEQLLPPGPQGSIDVRAFDIQKQPDALSFRVLLMRSGKPGERFSGSLQFIATGQLDGQTETLELKLLQAQGRGGSSETAHAGESPTSAAEQSPVVLKLNFDQFQRSQGLLALPLGFVPQSVTVRVVEGDIILATRRVDL